MNLTQLKAEIRKYIWQEMEIRGTARFPRPVYGRIPNFVGAEKAAENLRKTKEWKKANVVFVNPDSPQKPVRKNALLDGKIVIMATPRIRKGFLLLDPERIPINMLDIATTIKGAFRFGKTIHPKEIRIDMKVMGSVAVDTKGGRLGKGHGFSDIEYGILREYNTISEDTPLATTVHDIQVVDNIPVDEHDVPIDIIATPTRVIYTHTKYKKPAGINWNIIGQKDIESIPLLKELYLNRRRKG